MFASHFDRNGCHQSPDGIGGQQHSPADTLPPVSSSIRGNIAAVAALSSAATITGIATVVLMAADAGRLAVVGAVGVTLGALLMTISFAQDIIIAHRAEFDRSVRYRREMMHAFNYIGIQAGEIEIAKAQLAAMSATNPASTTAIISRRLH